ncbi:PhzF family phenazine biosynthesis protein [Cognatiyoonia sp. IB215446]|uniref:PhzF family phenazine biosynthesis protein n=1 Tax=Cognatiyoonia sp. IB215446 TaxID=3097355 RepID=UPI002A0BB00A|nr:PhzF family phenazine biosynthesis protein [Cognatiyoonia sp. IB215446]MDX8348760.1 PhzF family phenazine biosynthesis protein [Cognatiyoonia sp. IB215446]
MILTPARIALIFAIIALAPRPLSEQAHMTRYFVYDVFTDHAFGGNPLAVIPDATNLPETSLQKIAREFNYSETTFFYPAEDPAHTAKVRIFTPTMEIAFAGHPTIGTACALRDEGHVGDMVLELGVGPIPCTFHNGQVAFKTSAPLERLAHPDIALVAAALALPTEAVKTATHAPVQASLGLPFVFVELQNDQHLDACAPSIDVIKEGASRYPAGMDFSLLAYTRQGDQVNARMFAPLDNIPEDPATGSAAATMTALLTEALGHPLDLTIRQGVAMRRPSLIHARSDDSTPVRVTISGQAVRVMQGELVF